MSNRKVYHVLPNGSEWIGKLENTTSAVVTAATKEEAVEMTVKKAKDNIPSQVIIHKADGTIEKEYTYGNDPYPPEG